MKVLSTLFCASLVLARYPYDYNNGYSNNNQYGNSNYGNNYENSNNGYGNIHGNNDGKPYGNLYVPSVPYVLPLTFLRSASREAVMEFRKIGQDPTQSVRNVEEQRIKWAMKNRLEKQYKEYADAGENGVRKFFDSTKKLISRLDHFFTKSKNIEEDKSQSYDSMKKTVRNVFSGLTEDQKIIASFIVYTYGLNFFPFLNDMWCMECIESGEYPNGNGGYPGSNGGYPGNNGGYPGNNGGYPGGNGGSYPGGPYPGNGGGYPGWPNNNAGPYPGNNNNNNGGYPGGNGGFLGGNGNFPGGNGGFPGHNGGYPGNNGGYPGGNGWFPGSGGYPGNGDRLPNTNGGRRPSFGNGNSYGRK